MDHKVKKYGKACAFALAPAWFWLGTFILKPNPKYYLKYKVNLLKNLTNKHSIIFKSKLLNV